MGVRYFLTERDSSRNGYEWLGPRILDDMPEDPQEALEEAQRRIPALRGKSGLLCKLYRAELVGTFVY